MYCLPHAGGAANSYLPWVRSAHRPGLEFVPVEIPGRGTRLDEAPLTDMGELATEITKLISARSADNHFLLLGHSMGALLAYETTRRLTAAGGPLPRRLIVSGARPPGSPQDSQLHTLDDRRLAEALAVLGGTPKEVLRHQGLLRLLIPVVRADLSLLQAYYHGIEARPTTLSVPITALGGDRDRIAEPGWIAEWRPLTTAHFRYRILPGDHFFLHEHIGLVTDEIVEALRAPETPRDDAEPTEPETGP